MNRQLQLDHFSLALHRRAIDALRADPTLNARVRQTLTRWRSQAGETRSDALWSEWEQLLSDEPDALARAALSETDHGQLMQSVSPLGVLVTQRERTALLSQSRGYVALSQ